MSDEIIPHELRLSIMRLARRLRAQKADDTISDSQMSVLAKLHHEGSHTIGQLSDGERVTPPSMNRTVNSLETAGFVTRGAAPDDGRKVVVTITAVGTDLMVRTQSRRDAWFVSRLEQLDPEQRAALDAAASVIRELADS
jgi:DNA-binding MarR family transcriptional regulator